MDLEANMKETHITKIEDIIDIQKANGNINVRQVAFKLPCETDSNISATLVKSLETGLSEPKLGKNKQKLKKLRSKRKDLISDVISWPSDSDITVLRMKLYSNAGDKNKLGNVILGDGLHQPDSSSMVNLATLILKSQNPSKQSLVEEYLLPLTSWEHAVDSENKKVVPMEEILDYPEYTSETKTNEARCSHIDDLSLKDSDEYTEVNTKSKVARFLRLYFCPCCTCLYKLEKMQEQPSACFTKRC